MSRNSLDFGKARLSRNVPGAYRTTIQTVPGKLEQWKYAYRESDHDSRNGTLESMLLELRLSIDIALHNRLCRYESTIGVRRAIHTKLNKSSIRVTLEA